MIASSYRSRLSPRTATSSKGGAVRVAAAGRFEFFRREVFAAEGVGGGGGGELGDEVRGGLYDAGGV
ncbi:MAG: hypothetical protein ACREJB_00580, partial [Planctomycetaceae bacterium]